MGKRSDFDRKPQDHYDTFDPKAVMALKPHLNGVRRYAEPCEGNGHLVRQLNALGLDCVWASDINKGTDALALTRRDMVSRKVDAIITNPPWSRTLLHRMILHFQTLAPTWLLFDSDWMHNRMAVPYLDRCSDIVAIGRVKWIPDSPHSGKDNVSWYRFWHEYRGSTKFHGRTRAL
jgi:hypothetical protein